MKVLQSFFLVPTLLLSVLLTFIPSFADSEYLELPNGSKLKLGSTCPVCGMKVGGELGAPAIYAYKNGSLTGFAGIAAAVFKDGTVVGFDGARCLFIYNTIPTRFGIDVGKITHRFVTHFGTKELIDVKEAFLVLGAKIRGFMGYELIPFSSRQQAEEFKGRNGGKRIIKLGEVRPHDVDRKKK